MQHVSRWLRSFHSALRDAVGGHRQGGHAAVFCQWKVKRGTMAQEQLPLLIPKKWTKWFSLGDWHLKTIHLVYKWDGGGWTSRVLGNQHRLLSGGLREPPGNGMEWDSLLTSSESGRFALLGHGPLSFQGDCPVAFLPSKPVMTQGDVVLESKRTQNKIIDLSFFCISPLFFLLLGEKILQFLQNFKNILSSVANLSLIRFFENWIISSLIGIIKSWFQKLFILQERKTWALHITKFVFMIINIHIEEHLCVWKLFTSNYPTQNPPDNQVGLFLKSLWVVAALRVSTWLKCWLAIVWCCLFETGLFPRLLVGT